MVAHEGAGVKLPVYYGGVAFASKGGRLACLELQLFTALICMGVFFHDI